MTKKIKYELFDGKVVQIEVGDAAATFLQQSDKQLLLQTRRSNKNCISLELLKNKERRVLQSGRSRDKPKGGEIYVDYNADPFAVLYEREIIQELEKFEEEKHGNGNEEF